MVREYEFTYKDLINSFLLSGGLNLTWKMMIFLVMSLEQTKKSPLEQLNPRVSTIEQ